MLGIYARVSTDDQNIQQQKDILIDYCNKNNYHYRCYEDNGVSGSIANRPEWQRLLKNIDTYDGILVLKIDRITRSLRYAIEFYDLFMKIKEKKPDFKFISLYDNVDLSKPDGYFSFMLKCLLAEYELIQLDQRRQIGIERAKREGKYTGRKIGSKNKIKI